MRFQGIATLLLVAGLSTAVMLACSAPDPGEIQYGERVYAPNGGPGGSSSSGGASSSSSGGASSSASSSGAPADAFAGAAAYSATTPGPPNAPAKGKNAAHTGTGQDPAGQACLPCHAGFQFGGTVYGEAAGTTRVAAAEVRIVDATGKQLALVATDVDGNVWGTAAAPVTEGSKVGVRKDGKVKLMATPLKVGDGNCARNDANCHSVGKQGPIYLN